MTTTETAPPGMGAFEMGRVPHITFGAGRLADAPAIIAGLGGGPVLLVADTALKDLGVTDTLAAGLAGAGIAAEIAAEISGEPKQALVDRLAARARETGCRTVIGLGGGAAMDCAKLVAAIAGAPEQAARYALSARPVPAGRLPALAIPTTAGTGSEVTRTAIVSDAGGAKLWYWDEGLMFAHALLDPELTVTLPPTITAWTGIDAAAHALEASTARSTNASGLLYGHQALVMLARALPRAVADGSDRAARAQMLWASTIAGLALHNCNTHLGHSISHALGSLAPVHHGLATGLALGVALPWLSERTDDPLLARAAAALGGPARADALGPVFTALMRDAGIPLELPGAATGITADALARQIGSPANRPMAVNALADVGDADIAALAERLLALPAAAQAA